MRTITVLGASGFIGRHLIEYLHQRELPCFGPKRSSDLRQTHLGSVIYCIGLTADFRSHPFETVEAHVCKLMDVLKDCEFDSFLYVSSTRIYGHRNATAREDDSVQVDPSDHDHIYNISKVMGESLSLNCGRPARVVRLSNVYGHDPRSQNFLATIIRDATQRKKVVLQTSLDSERDYISVSDVVRLLVEVATSGSHPIYNLASGVNVTNLEITQALRELTGCRVETCPDAPKITVPVINVDRIAKEFGFQPARILDDLPALVGHAGVPLG
jgi:nucleoside-diphosphate-sugar epimerase